MSEKPAQETVPSVRRPRRVAIAALLTGLQGMVVTGLGLAMLIMVFLGDPDGLVQAGTGALTVLLLALLPLIAGHGLWRLRRWSRGPAVVVQILALPTAWHMAQIGEEWRLAAVPVAVVALTVLGCLANVVAAEALQVGHQPDATGEAAEHAEGRHQAGEAGQPGTGDRAAVEERDHEVGPTVDPDSDRGTAEDGGWTQDEGPESGPAAVRP